MVGENLGWDTDLAIEFNNRNNADPTGPVLGTVISISPLQISIYNNKVILTEKQCYICSNLLSEKGNIILDNVADHGEISTTCTITNIINAGDNLLCLPTIDGQRFFIVDKVVG